MSGDQFGEFLQDFLQESVERLDRVQELLLSLPESTGQDRPGLIVDAKRELHTLKGNSGMMGLKDLQSLAHRLEDEVVALSSEGPDVGPILAGLDAFRRILLQCAGQASVPKAPEEAPAESAEPGGHSAGSVRIPFQTLDSLVELVAEMVVFRNRLSDSIATGRHGADASRAWDDVEGAQEALLKNLGALQSEVMQLRMVPLSTVFRHLRRLAFDEGRGQGKKVRFDAFGGETPVDKALLEVASEALGHLVRNAVVHAIEPPEVRRERAKPPEGRVSLTAIMQSGEVWIDVSDDGGGIDREALREAARLRGMDSSALEDPYSLLFMPDFSTRARADMSGGRGMGLASVLEAVRRIGGSIEVTSRPGSGTRFRLRLPLSVSVTRALLLRADGEDYALPLLAVSEALPFSPGDGHEINHSGVYWWRGFVVPVLDLGVLYGTSQRPRAGGFAIIIEADGKNRGLLVEDILGIRDIVVKQLDPVLGRPPGISGTTILGDGRVILILEPRGLVDLKPSAGAQGGGGATAAPRGQ